jgi:hypothetical protein
MATIGRLSYFNTSVATRRSHTTTHRVADTFPPAVRNLLQSGLLRRTKGAYPVPSVAASLSRRYHQLHHEHERDAICNACHPGTDAAEAVAATTNMIRDGTVPPDAIYYTILKGGYEREGLRPILHISALGGMRLYERDADLHVLAAITQPLVIPEPKRPAIGPRSERRLGLVTCRTSESFV